MILALDVHYRETEAKAVGVLFHWEDTEPRKVFVEDIQEVEDYIPGEFYKRELPCLLKVIGKIDLETIEAIIIDGHIYINNNWEYGLGGKLYEKLNKQIPIIGVAKTPFFKNKETIKELYRGKSKNPLYISSIGLDFTINKIKNMYGEFRIPTILKQLDTYVIFPLLGTFKSIVFI